MKYIWLGIKSIRAPRFRKLNKEDYDTILFILFAFFVVCVAFAAGWAIVFGLAHLAMAIVGASWKVALSSAMLACVALVMLALVLSSLYKTGKQQS